MTNLQLLGTLLASPRRFFEELDRQPRYALPLWLVLLTTAGLLLWYYGTVDTRWVIEQALNANPRAAALSEADRERAVAFMSPATLAASSVIGGVLVILALRALEALWYRLAGAATGTARGYRHWFAFAWWTSLPNVLGIVPAALTLAFSSSRQIEAGAMQPLSLNELFFHRGMGEPGYTLLSNVGVLGLATLALTIYGVHRWSRRSWVYGTLLVLIGAALLFVPWALLSLRAT